MEILALGGSLKKASNVPRMEGGEDSRYSVYLACFVDIIASRCHVPRTKYRARHHVLVMIRLVPQQDLRPKERGRQFERPHVSFGPKIVRRSRRVGRNFCHAVIAPVIRSELDILFVLFPKPSVLEACENGVGRATDTDNLDTSRASRIARYDFSAVEEIWRFVDFLLQPIWPAGEIGSSQQREIKHSH